MRAHASACISVFAAAGHPGGANAAAHSGDCARARRAAARGWRTGIAAASATGDWVAAARPPRVGSQRADRAIHGGTVACSVAARHDCRVHGRRSRWPAIAGGVRFRLADQEGVMKENSDHRVTTLEALAALYGEPYGPAIVKEIDHINPHYRKFIEA